MVIWDFDTKWGQRKVVDLKWKLKELKVALFVHTKTTNELEQAIEQAVTSWNHQDRAGTKFS